jgi:hypothetical protein
LLFEEVDHEFLLWVHLAQDFLELSEVIITAHERGVQIVHEDFTELTVTALRHLLQHIVVLYKVGLDQVELLAALEEALHLLHEVLLRFLGLRVRNLFP